MDCCGIYLVVVAILLALFRWRWRAIERDWNKPKR